MKKEEDVDGTYYMVEKSVLNPINQISTSILNGSEDLQQYQQSMQKKSKNKKMKSSRRKACFCAVPGGKKCQVF